MLDRNELAAGLSRLGYAIEKTHADGRFEIGGASRAVVEAFSTRRAEIEVAMAERNLGSSADSPRLAERAALMTRAAKREIDRAELRGVWERQAADLGFDAKAFVAEAAAKTAAPGMAQPRAVREPGAAPVIGDRDSGVAADTAPVDAAGAARETKAAAVPGPGAVEVRTPGARPAAEAVAWAMAHLAEREALFARTDLLAAALAHAPGAVTIDAVEREVTALRKAGVLHAVRLPGAEDSLATEKSAGEERETVALMHAGQGQGRVPMRGWSVQGHLDNGPLTAGQKEAVKLILSAKDRTVGVQGYAGTGKTTMLDRARVREARRQRRRGEAGQHRGRGRRALARALA